MSIVLNFFYIILFLFYAPCLWFKGKLHRGYAQRFGRIDELSKRSLADKKHIWIHAVSVGEVMAIRDLVHRLADKHPHFPVVCTTVTKTGYELAHKLFQDKVTVLYAPLDFSWVVKTFIRAIDPKVYISTETEWWPNLYRSLSKKQVPILQINGRISDKAFKGYKRASWMTKRIFHCVTHFYMQSQGQQDRLLALGAPQEKVEVLGNLKFDNFPDASLQSEKILLKETRLWIAGSTHPGEEEMILESYNRLKQEHSSLRLVLCPRHIERVRDVVSMVERKGYRPLYFSAWHKKDFSAHEVLIVDTIGHLSALYAVAHIVFIGKTFRVGGGQNMLEPAYFGVPTLVGPMTENFKQVMDILLEEKAILQVSEPDQMAEEISHLLKDSLRYRALGDAAQRVVMRYRGATSRTCEKIEAHL